MSKPLANFRNGLARLFYRAGRGLSVDLTPAEAEARQREGHRRRRALWRLVVAVAPVLVAAAVALFGQDYLLPVGRFLLRLAGVDAAASSPTPSGTAWAVTGSVFAVAALWTWLFYLRLRTDDRERDAEQERERAAYLQTVLGLPDLNVLWAYYERYYTTLAALAERRIPDTQREIADDLLVGLAVIAKMAQDFAGPEGAHYGSSLMVVVPQERIGDLPAKYVTEPDRGGRLRFAGDRPGLLTFDGLLVLPEDLAVKAPPRVNGGTYPLVVLPIRRTPDDQILPGAPEAVVASKRDLSVYRDTRTLADKQCQGFSRLTRDAVRDYFAEGGEGEHIRSIAAIRLDAATGPLAVLNVDSDTVDVLGTSSTYYPSFRELVQPLLRLLQPRIEAYRVHWWASVEEAKRREVAEAVVRETVAEADTPGGE